MSVTKRGAGYQANFLLKGWPRVRVQFETETEANAYELECRAAHALGKPCPAPQGEAGRAGRVATIEELVRHCAKVRWSSRKAGKGLTHNAQQFADWVGPKVEVVHALTPAKVDEYVVARQQGKSKSGSTVNRHLSAISVLLDQAVRQKLIPARFDLPWQKEASSRLRFYTVEEETQILGTLALWGQDNYIDLFTFLVDTGARLGETELLPWGDIRGRAVTFIGPHTKNGETRTVTATDRVVASLARLRARYPNFRGPFDWLDRQALRVLWNRLRAHFEWMGEDTVVHTFRHTCASRLVQSGVDLFRVKTWMGHKNIETTMRYSHLAPKHLEELADVLAKFAASKAA